MEPHGEFTYIVNGLELDPVLTSPADHMSPDREAISLHSKDTEDTDVVTYSTDDDEHDNDDNPSRSTEFFSKRPLTVPWRRYKLAHLVLRVRGCLASRPCAVCLYLAVTLQLILGAICLVVVSVLVVRPFREISTYRSGNCTVVEVDYGDDRRCSCGKGCSSLYPCVRISVQIVDRNYQQEINRMETNRMEPNRTKTQQSSVLYENEVIMNRQCSYYPPCKSSEIANTMTVEGYVSRFGSTDHSFPCLYNPLYPTRVIRTQRFQLKHVVHGVLWSCVILISAVVILSVLIKMNGIKCL